MTTPLTIADNERQAERRDAERKIVHLRRAIRQIYPDRDDSQVLSELTILLSELRAAEAVLGNGKP